MIESHQWYRGSGDFFVRQFFVKDTIFGIKNAPFWVNLVGKIEILSTYISFIFSVGNLHLQLSVGKFTSYCPQPFLIHNAAEAHVWYT